MQGSSTQNFPLAMSCCTWGAQSSIARLFGLALTHSTGPIGAGNQRLIICLFFQTSTLNRSGAIPQKRVQNAAAISPRAPRPFVPAGINHRSC
jgi:hypothetical protein